MGKAKSGKRPISQWINILLYLLVGAGSGILVLMDLEKYQAGGASKADCIIRLVLLFISLYLAMFLLLQFAYPLTKKTVSALRDELDRKEK